MINNETLNIIKNDKSEFSFESRVNYYLGYNLINQDVSHIPLKSNPKIDTGFSKNAYDIPFKKLLKKTNNFKKKLNFRLGDNNSDTDPTVIVKTRGINCDNGVILKCLNFPRHWHSYYDYSNNRINTIPFKKKLPIVFWRGATTGNHNLPFKNNRLKLVEKYHSGYPNIDVGFSLLCQGKQEFRIYKKKKTDINTFLQHKYIISVPGNDKDSGLNWKLYSNSIVFMPKPVITSWTMETKLIPNYHYILLKDDFSDLIEKYNWCEKNQDKCIQIIKNANNFMKMFSNQKKENEIEEAVINRYFKLIKKNN